MQERAPSMVRSIQPSLVGSEYGVRGWRRRRWWWRLGSTASCTIRLPRVHRAPVTIKRILDLGLRVSLDVPARPRINRRNNPRRRPLVLPSLSVQVLGDPGRTSGLRVDLMYQYRRAASSPLDETPRGSRHAVRLC
jgi:hypothetical protein